MKPELTSRERVRLALNHQEPDRVPINITWTSKPYIDVRRELGLPEEAVRPNVLDRVTASRDVVERMSCDIIEVGLKASQRDAKFDPALDSFTNEYGVPFRKVYRRDGGFQFELCGHPIEEPTFEAIEQFDWPDPFDPARYEGVADHVRHLYETTDYAILARLGGSIWEWASWMTGGENWLCYTMTDPDFCVALMQRIASIEKTMYLEGLNRVGKYLSILRVGGEDFGTQDGLLISPTMFRTLVKPILKDVYASFRERLADLGNYDCKLMIHSCGSIEPLLEDYIEMGIDVIDPVQTRARNMNGLHLKERYGDRLSFHGGIDTQWILPFGTEDEVVEETRRKIEMLAPGGGFILRPTHNVQADVSGRKLIKMVEVALEYGRYPVRQTYDREYLLSLDY